MARNTAKGRAAHREESPGPVEPLPDVPGPGTSPVTSLLVADIGMRIADRLFRHTAERGLLRMKFPPNEARDIVEGRSLGHSLVAKTIARVATKSVPGALLVTGGLIAKAIFDRGLSRRGPGKRKLRKANKRAENAD